MGFLKARSRLRQEVLAGLSRCDWDSLKVFIQEAIPENELILSVVMKSSDYLTDNPD